jgi:hypothetical protein
MNRYLLTVTFPLVVKTMIEDTKRVEEFIGREAYGAGSGFGGRDVEFAFATREERTAAIIKLLQSGRNYDVVTDYAED